MDGGGEPRSVGVTGSQTTAAPAPGTSPAAETGGRPAPRVVLGLPLYDSGEPLGEALESILSQSYEGFRLVIVDDRSNDATLEIIERYWALDDRIDYHRNEHRLGLTRNWRRAFEVATSTYPEAEFFAWISDHDVWHPRWLESLVATLERRPDASMVSSGSAVIVDDRGLEPRRPSTDTSDLGAFSKRLEAVSTKVRAGHVIYGLLRVSAVRRAGGFRHVLYADRLMLTELALYGALVNVPDILWYKRPTGATTLGRQRRACFPDGIPLYARFPWWVQHAATLAWVLAVRGRGRPLISRTAGLGIALRSLRSNGRVATTHRWTWYVKRRKALAPAKAKDTGGTAQRLRSRLRSELRSAEVLLRQDAYEVHHGKEDG